MELIEKTLSEKEIFNGRIIRFHVDSIELADGSKGLREVAEHPGGVCIAAVTKDLELLFVRQYRYPMHEVCLELPAGKLEKGEDPLLAAKRELLEETGCTGRDFCFMGNMYPTPGFCSEIDRLFFCYVDKEGADLNLDADEFIETERIPYKEAVKMVMENKIPDAKTQLLILKAAQIIESEA
ncbi:MAG: NUDIX hydrolase [Lachnospiraceae bacterium]|nr:NUDIX hydrolase [Lachnospiraceae bacterium]